jgi:flagellar biosynthesis/type III secretory pathway protein FliH
MTVSEEERLRAWEMSAEKFELDLQSDMIEARRAGHAEGLAEGLAEGRSQGLAEAQSNAQVRIRQLEEEIQRLREKLSGTQEAAQE